MKTIDEREIQKTTKEKQKQKGARPKEKQKQKGARPTEAIVKG